MHRRKVNQEEVQPQDDTVVFYKSRKANGHQSHHNLLPGQRNKRKGNPISIPYQSSRPKHAPVSIDRCDASRFFTPTTDLPTTPHARSTRLGILKKTDDSKQRSIPKPHGFGKATMVLSSDDEDKRNNILGKTRKENAHIKKPIFTSPFAFGRPSSSSNITPVSQSKPLSKKQMALGAGRSPQSSQIHNSHRTSPKVPYHSFFQNHQRDDINRSLPYWREQRDRRQPVNHHRRFESSSDEASVVDNEPMKMKRKTTTTTTTATNTATIDTTAPIDTSDNDEIYHSACSISSDPKYSDDDDDHDDGNGYNTIIKNHNTPTDSALKRNDSKEQLINSLNSIDNTRSKGQTLNSTTKQNQQQQSLQPPLLSPSPSSPSSPSSSSTTKELRLRVKDNGSPAPVELSDDEMYEVHNTLFTYPINRSKGSITVTLEDQKRLGPNQFLNDTIIAFYLKFLMDSYSTPNGYRNCNSKTRAATENTHIFSSFFYNRLAPGTGQGTGLGTRANLSKRKPISYENVRKWTSKIDLFSKKYAIFPINENWHWYLVLVCNIDKCIPEQTNADPLSTTAACDRPHIFILDSLGGTQKDTIANINQYLLLEAQHRRNVDPSDFVQPRTHHAKVPKQDNSCDCGVFLLHFVDQFLNSPQNFIRILLDRDAQHIKWKEGEIKDKRTELKSLFRKIHIEYSVEHGTKVII